MTDYIYHVTLNTGHVRMSHPNEVNRELYFVLRRFLRDSLAPNGTEIIKAGYRLKTTQSAGQTIATLFGPSGAPILTTGCSPDGDPEMWRIMHKDVDGLKTNPQKPPTGPYIADRLEIGSVVHLDALGWTADFTRCFGWAVIAPEKIR